MMNTQSTNGSVLHSFSSRTSTVQIVISQRECLIYRDFLFTQQAHLVNSLVNLTISCTSDTNEVALSRRPVLPVLPRPSLRPLWTGLIARSGQRFQGTAMSQSEVARKRKVSELEARWKPSLSFCEAITAEWCSLPHLVVLRSSKLDSNNKVCVYIYIYT